MKMIRWAMVFVVLVIVASAGVAVYTVFFGGKDLAVPRLREMSVLDAMEEVKRLGLQAKIDQVDSTLSPGMVLAQWPEPGTKVRKETTLILKVSRGAVNRKAIPDVRGMEYSKAVATLEQNGFSAGDVVRLNDESRPAGSVLAQNPAAPATVPQGRKVDLIVSSGGAVKGGKIPVPELSQQDEKTAKKLLSESSLTLAGVEYVYNQNTNEGMVMGTKPRAGALVRPGDGVTLVVSTLRKPDKVEIATPSGGKVTAPGMTQTTPGVAPDGASERVSVTAEPSGKPTPSSSAPVAPGGKQSVAKVRYQVPPLSKSMSLRIEMVDANGTRQLLSREVRGGEYISLDAPFSKEGVVTIYLGGEFVWQDRFR
jgi:beta-lactam-binding protein with PASTA domain